MCYVQAMVVYSQGDKEGQRVPPCAHLTLSVSTVNRGSISQIDDSDEDLVALQF